MKAMKNLGKVGRYVDPSMPVWLKLTIAAMIGVLVGYCWGAYDPGLAYGAEVDPFAATIQVESLNKAVGGPLSDYERGVNDALLATMLLHLEQRLDGSNRTWGEMAKIVMRRLDVRPNHLLRKE